MGGDFTTPYFPFGWRRLPGVDGVRGFAGGGLLAPGRKPLLSPRDGGHYDPPPRLTAGAHVVRRTPFTSNCDSMSRDCKLVFTNGCFDLLHPGHVDLLQRARALGDRLIVGLNSDESVRTLKGPTRPIWSEQERAAMLLALRCVDQVVIFNERTPARLIEDLRPDVLVKGGDWPVDKIVGAKTVQRYGGEVHSIPLLEGYSTTSLIARLQALEEPNTWRRAS